MKIISTDNFSRDEIDDQLICENVSEVMAHFIVTALNETYCKSDDSPRHYKMVPDDYKLKEFEP